MTSISPGDIAKMMGRVVSLGNSMWTIGGSASLNVMEAVGTQYN